MTIFSLFSVFCGVFCWFTTFRKVNNMADNFKTVTLEGKINQIQFYPLSSKTL